MKIGIVGAGKVGCTIGKYLALNNFEISGYYSRTQKSASDAAEFIGTDVFNDLNELVLNSDIIFLTVPDSAINQVWHSIPKDYVHGKIFCHCSGAMTSMQAFDDVQNCGAYGYSVHPLFAVSDKYNAYKEMNNVFFTIEGNIEKLQDIQNIFIKCGNPVKVISGENKVLYHAAAAVASNHIVALVSKSLSMLEECGFNRQEALNALRPILLGNMSHIANYGTVASLTGPVERCDLSTVKKHLETLRSKQDKALYSLLSLELVKIAQEKHPNRNYSSMKELLEKEC